VPLDGGCVVGRTQHLWMSSCLSSIHHRPFLLPADRRAFGHEKRFGVSTAFNDSYAHYHWISSQDALGFVVDEELSDLSRHGILSNWPNLAGNNGVMLGKLDG
jgi:hypothetical protein